MTDTYTETVALQTWRVAQCPFTIEYSTQTLDDIRLAVMDAFSSLPDGGAEIGGVLLGKYENERLIITQYLPLDSEHAFGPSFTLSPKDQTALEELLAAARLNFNDLQPVGWYHSHTRSAICLSDADLDIHNRYFREAWQVALVLRPSSYEPARAGFFFREADGNLHAEASYQEVTLGALPVSLPPTGVPSVSPEPPFETPSDQPVLVSEPVTQLPPPAMEAEADTPERPPQLLLVPPPPENAPATPALVKALPEPWPTLKAETPEPSPAFKPAVKNELPVEPERAAPDFLQLPPRRSRRWFGMTATIAALLALAAAGYQKRAAWLPRQRAASPRVTAKPVSHTAAVRPAAPVLPQDPPAAVPVKSALPPAPPSPPQDTLLRKQAAELQKTTAELARQNAELSKANADLRQQKDDLTRQAAKLKTELAADAAHAKNLQQQLDQLRAQQQRRRLANQSNEPLP